MKSIMHTVKGFCYLCGRECQTHKHHIFGGPNRQKSEKLGLWVYLCPECHNMSNRGVHFNKQRDLLLKQMAQARYETTHTRQEFLSEIGRNYLDD